MGYTFFWKGYLSGGQPLHGVGLAIKNTLRPRRAETPVGISERPMSLRIPLGKNRFATLLSAYAPTLPSKSEAKDSVYQSLDEALRRIPKNDEMLEWSARQAWRWPGSCKWVEITHSLL
ncbi:hypothetical protein KUCAC02_031376 [Chaenocephalus aceratus]|nr:hypothetical protein KUCAC02_031376 [Chaenocephalus aceratus]